MAESKREGPQAVREAERRSSQDQERAGQAAQQQAKQFAEIGREGALRATEASTAAASGAARSGSAIAECAQEIAAAWAHYAENVMRHTSEASRALLRARTLTEVLDVQAKLLSDNMQAFLDQSTKFAEAASRMATRPFEAIKEAGAEQTRR